MNFLTVDRRPYAFGRKGAHGTAARGERGLKISRIRATPINLPLEAPLWWTGGLYPGTSKAVVEVETDEGLIGLGEAPSSDVSEMIAAMGEVLAGQDPLDIAACERLCVPPWQIVQNTDDARVVKAFGAIEIALWDLRGKVWDQPLATLLGGKVRDTVAFSEYFGFREGREMTPEAVVDYCLAMREQHGSTILRASSSAAIPCSRLKPCAACAKRWGRPPRSGSIPTCNGRFRRRAASCESSPT